MEMNLPRKKPRVSVVKVFFVFVILSLIAGISALGYLYFQTREELKFLSSPEGQQQLVKDETAQITTKKDGNSINLIYATGISPKSGFFVKNKESSIS